MDPLGLIIVVGVALLIHPPMMEFLLRTDPPVIDIEDVRLCMSDGRSRWSAGEFRALASCLLTPVTPRYVA